MPDFPFNFIIIPAVIIATAVYSARFAKEGLTSWYPHLKKPTWAPPEILIKEIMIFLYVITGLAILWYWNVPVVGWLHYVVAVVLLQNAYLNATWNRTFFVQRDLPKSLQHIKLLNATTAISAIIIAFDSLIGAALMLPYVAWITYTTYLMKEIVRMNGGHSSHSKHAEPEPAE